MNAHTTDVNPSSDRLSILTCDRRLKMTKVHRRTPRGTWDSQQYGAAKTYSARVVEVSSFADMIRLLRRLERDRRSIIIRDLPNADTVLGSCNRRMDQFGPQTIGLRCLGVDLDDLMVRDIMGVEKIDHSSRESMEAAIVAVVEKIFPEGLRDASVYYQWSASAGVKDWDQYRLHLWWYLDRPVFRGSLKRWAKEIDGVDASFFDSVRVHYTAAPVFIAPDGTEMQDILGTDAAGSLRSGVIRRSSDIATAPPEWLTRSGHDMLLTRERLVRNEEYARRLEAERNSGRSPVGRARLKDRAEAYLMAIVDSIVRDLPGTGRYPYVRSKVRSAFGLRDKINPTEIARILRPECERAFSLSGRSAKAAQGEASRLIGPLIADAKGRAPARPLPDNSDAPTPTKPTPKPKAIAKPGALLTYTQDPPEAEEDGLPWLQPEDGWHDKTLTPVSLDSARAWLDIATLTATERGGAHAIAAPAGSGKSYAAKRRALIEHTQRLDVRAQLVVPTIALAKEAADDMNAMAMLADHHGFIAVVAASRRGPDENGEGQTCYRYDEVSAASRTSPEGAREICKRCEHHPRQVGNRRDCCPFYRSVIGEQTADVVVKSHARWILEGEPEDAEDAFAVTVVDEDPSSTMIHQGSLSADDIVTLIAAGDIKIEPSTLGQLNLLLADSITRTVKTDELAAMVFAGSISVNDEYAAGATAVEEALQLEDVTARQARLNASIPWRTIAGLGEAVANGWGASILKEGRLLVSHTIPLPLGNAGTILHLDATGSAARTRALFGADATFKRPRVEWPEHAKVTWIPIDAGTRSRLHKVHQGARRVPLIWNAALERFGGDGSLIVTSKKNRDKSLWTGQVLKSLEARGTAVIHHKGPGGRGLNKYQDRGTVIIDPWHVPQHVIDQMAFAWCRIAGDDWSDEATRGRWKVEASAQLLSAEVLQEIARIRPLSATADDPKRICIIDRRDPRSLGLPLDEVVDPDRLVWEAFGATTGIDTAPSIVSAAVATAGGLYLPTIDLRSPAPMRPRDISGAARTSNPLARQYILSSDVLESCLSNEQNPWQNVGLIMNGWARNHGGWEALATRGDVGLAFVETERGGHAYPVLFTGDLYRERLDGWLRSAGVNRWRLRGESAWYSSADIDEKVISAVLELPVRDASQVTASAVIKAIATARGCVEKTAKRQLEKHCAPEESIDAFVRRLWVELQTDRAAHVAAVVADRQDVSWFTATCKVTQTIGVELSAWRDGFPLPDEA